MNLLIQKIIDNIIINGAILKDYPKQGVSFLTLDSLFNDPGSRKIISKAVTSAINPSSFDSVAGIASRGYLFSEMIANQFTDKGENLIQKAKSRDNSHFIQMDIQTEYSSDALQVRKDTIKEGKKYLLADDLIATGGSVMAAIKLIKACGGKVDTVIVMTELLDFGAREALKKEGVELISLLKFTKQDLQELMLIQERYRENHSIPITYKLSHHASDGKQTLASGVQQFNINRLITLKHNKLTKKYAKKGIFFTPTAEAIPNKAINFYNQGCAIKPWHINPKKVERNNFKIFSTGDPFAVLSPEVEISGENINIHIGVDHAIYSPLVLLQEALQLCRCVYEHGAERITITLPEQFHPILHSNDFNFLLMKLFKASGVNKIYFYDKNYAGVLDETNIKDVIPITVAQQSDIEHYQISQKDLLNYLQLPNNSQTNNLDQQIMGAMRSSNLNSFRVKSESNPNDSNMISTPAAIKVPEIKNQPHVLLCCSANRPLAEKIAENLRMCGEKVELYFIQGKGEQAKIPSEAIICGAKVTIVQSTRPNPDDLEEVKDYQKNGASSYFFEAAMVARQAHLRGAAKINLINPYQFNARSDKAENNPKGKTGAYVQQYGMLFEAAGVNQVITAECHDTHTMSGAFTGKKIKGIAVPALTVISTKLVADWMNDPHHPLQGQLRLVTPDAGATKRTKELTQQLQSIMGKKLCESRILGDKQRDSHEDNSALINSLNAGDIAINAHDKYLITDDETATGGTLCQAITNLKASGANDISVIVIHNNMPLDWLSRQLCLARFLYLGVNDLHFSDTQEMGSLAKNYEGLIQTYSQKSLLSSHVVEEQAFIWFKENIAKDFSDKTTEHLNQEFTRFKSMFNQFESRITIHSLASEFANQVSAKQAKVNTLESTVDLPAANALSFYTSGTSLFPQPKVQNPLPNNSVLIDNSRSLSLNHR